MGESGHVKDVDFKFCGCCGRLLPALPMYFNRSKTGYAGLYSFCKKCHYNNKKMYERRRPEHYKQYKQKYRKQKRREYLDSIGETEESLKAKQKAEQKAKKKTKTLTERKAYLKRKSVRNPKKIKGNKRPARIDIFGNKKCTKCGEWKRNNDDNYSMRTDYDEPVLNRICKECCAIRTSKYGANKIIIDTPLFIELSKYDETRKDPYNHTLGQCRCAYCGRWVNPTYMAVKSRIGSFNYLAFGENRIYCEGDQCREACPTYKQQFYPKGFKVNSAREVDPALRIMCLERDEWECQKCGANSPETTLHAHHILSYKRNIMLANDILNLITLCKECHNEIHHTEGCGYHELRCG